MQIDSELVPKITRRKTIDMLHTLYNRPKYVDPNILIHFFAVLSGTHGPLAATTSMATNGISNDATSITMSTEAMITTTAMTEMKSQLLKNLERVFNHIEFGRKLDMQMLMGVDSFVTSLLDPTATSAHSHASAANSNATSLTYIFKETMNLLADHNLNDSIRFLKK